MNCIKDSPPEKKSFFPSEERKIRESTDIGSVFLALEENFFTSKALLNWLVTEPMTENNQIAYKAVCVNISPNEQYLEDMYHFLIKKPEYILFATGYGLSVDIPARIDGDINDTILKYIINGLSEIRSNANLKCREIAALILSGNGSPKYLEEKLLTCCKARNFPHIRNVSGHSYNLALVASDWTTKFRYNDGLAILILHRVSKLQQEAPSYYSCVAYKAYHKVAVKLYKDKLLTQLSRDELITFNTFFPDIIDQKLLSYNNLAYKIALLSNDIAGYVLGLPVQNYIPNEEQIHNILAYLTDMGLSKYVEHIREYVAKTYTQTLPFPTKPTVYSNDSDVIMEDIDNYVPFDIVAFQDGDYIYRFTRPEFDRLMESKKNHWTNEWLSPTILSTIKSRVKASKELGLPPSRPLTELLDRVEKGTLFQIDEVPAQIISSDGTTNTGSRTDRRILVASHTLAFYASEREEDFDVEEEEDFDVEEEEDFDVEEEDDFEDDGEVWHTIPNPIARTLPIDELAMYNLQQEALSSTQQLDFQGMFNIAQTAVNNLMTEDRINNLEAQTSHELVTSIFSMFMNASNNIEREVSNPRRNLLNEFNMADNDDGVFYEDSEDMEDVDMGIFDVD